jgi:branched-chain amino acid transport system permease protein
VLSQRLFLVLLFAGLALLPIAANEYVVFVGNLAMLSIILSVGLNLLMGFAGQFAFANAAIYGIAAYATGILQVKLALSYWIAAPTGALVALAIGTLLAYPALRVSGIYLALVTLAFAQVTQWLMVHWVGLTFGAMGFRAPKPGFGLVNPEHGIYYLTWLVAAALVVLAWRIARSRFGRALVAMRDSEVAAEALGIDLLRYKAIAFALAAAYAGLAGSLYCALLGFVSPESFTLFEMVRQQAMVLVGGLGSVVGGVIGAVLLVYLTELMRGLKEVQEIVFGALLLMFVIFRPQGVVALLRRWLPGWDEALHWSDRRVRLEIGRGDQVSTPSASQDR